MTTTPKPEPASDAEIEYIRNVRQINILERLSLIARIEADRARIRALELENSGLKGIAKAWAQQRDEARTEVARLNGICDRLAAAGTSEPEPGR